MRRKDETMKFLNVEYVSVEERVARRDSRLMRVERLKRLKQAHIASKATRVESDKTDLLEQHITK